MLNPRLRNIKFVPTFFHVESVEVRPRGFKSRRFPSPPIYPWIICSPLLQLVLETLEPLPEDRKCFRMINGVLVERTVKDVIPALKTNSEGLRKVLEDLVKQYNSKQAEMEKWKVS